MINITSLLSLHGFFKHLYVCRRFSCKACLCAFTLLAFVSVTTAASAEKPHIGWIENAQLSLHPELIVKAKIDTGAQSSSLHATHIEYLPPNAEQPDRVRFTLLTGKVMEQPLVRKTEIKLKTGGFQSRPVIRAQLCLGNRLQTIELNLVNRAHFAYPLLIGRPQLRDYLVDVSSKQLLGAPRCPEMPSK